MEPLLLEIVFIKTAIIQARALLLLYMVGFPQATNSAMLAYMTNTVDDVSGSNEQS